VQVNWDGASGIVSGVKYQTLYLFVCLPSVCYSRNIVC